MTVDHRGVVVHAASADLSQFVIRLQYIRMLALLNSQWLLRIGPVGCEDSCLIRTRPSFGTLLGLSLPEMAVVPQTVRKWVDGRASTSTEHAA